MTTGRVSRGLVATGGDPAARLHVKPLPVRGGIDAE
jgi:hypothetical protein